MICSKDSENNTEKFIIIKYILNIKNYLSIIFEKYIERQFLLIYTLKILPQAWTTSPFLKKIKNKKLLNLNMTKFKMHEILLNPISMTSQKKSF